MPAPPDPTLGVLLISGTHERAQYAFVLATAAAAIGREVVVFATNRGCHALLQDWSGLEEAGRDAAIRASGVAGLDALRDAASALGLRLIACEAGLRAEGLDARTPFRGVEVAGAVTFLSAVGAGQIVVL